LEQPYWSEVIQDVIGGREPKPRSTGLTMVIDTGWTVGMMRDLLQLAGDHIDFWKFGFASASVCPPDRILDKITLCQEYNVLAYPGGTSLEIAYTQGVFHTYLQALWKSGVKVVEVSDGTIELPVSKRYEMIHDAKEIGFTVITEVGKKSPECALSLQEQARLIKEDIRHGASYVIVEGREAGTDIGVYDKDGDVLQEDVETLMELVSPFEAKLIWEAPIGKQQIYYLKRYGNHMNFGNVRPTDVVALESLRRGFRSDTFRTVLQQSALAVKA
jgi:phosphosulfolactate synthase